MASFAAVQSGHELPRRQRRAGRPGDAIGPDRAASAARSTAAIFVLRREIFDYIKDGEELVEKPFRRLIEKQLLGAYRHDGFWQAMDTFKDKITFDRMEARGKCPWMVWKNA